MKKLTFVMTMVLAVLLASCSKKQGSCLIPDNALIVLRFDMTKMLENTGMKGDDTSLKKEVEKLIKDAGIDKEAREKLLEIVDDPTSSGIDFTEPMFAYGALTEQRGGFAGGFVGSVASKGDLKDAIEKLSNEADDISLEEYENGDVQYVMLDRHSALVFNGDWFHIGPVESDIDDTIEQLLDRADGKDNIEDNEAFKQMCERNGLMQWAFFGSGIENLPGIEEARRQMPEGCDFKDFACIMDFIINKGEIVVETEALLMSDEWKKQSEQIEFKTIEKSQAKYADADGALAVVNFDAKGIFKYIRKMAENAGLRGRDLDQLDELKPIFDILTGTGLVAINSWEEDEDPEVVAYLGTRRNDLVNKVVEGKTTDDGVVLLEPDCYLLPVDYDFDYNDSIGDWVMTPTKFMQLGWKNNQTYILMNTVNEPFDTPRKPFTEVKGVGVYAYASGDILGRAVASIDYSLDRAGMAVADIVDNAEFYLESPVKTVFRIAMREKDKSPVVAIIDYLKRQFR